VPDAQGAAVYQLAALAAEAVQAVALVAE